MDIPTELRVNSSDCNQQHAEHGNCGGSSICSRLTAQQVEAFTSKPSRKHEADVLGGVVVMNGFPSLSMSFVTLVWWRR